MKKCNTCNILKPFEDFFKHKRMKDGYTNICKKCRKLEFDEKMENPDFVEKERERARDKYQRLYIGKPLNLESNKKHGIKYNLIYPEKYKAKTLCKRLPRGDEENLHHWSYNIEHAKDIIPLNKIFHKKIHRFIIYDQERMMYRIAKTGELLDTKEKHVEFINTLHYV